MIKEQEFMDKYKDLWLRTILVLFWHNQSLNTFKFILFHIFSWMCEYNMYCASMVLLGSKVRTFWEAHKIWKNLPHGLYIYLVNVQTTRKIFFKFCVLLRKSEHYEPVWDRPIWDGTLWDGHVYDRSIWNRLLWDGPMGVCKLKSQIFCS